MVVVAFDTHRSGFVDSPGVVVQDIDFNRKVDGVSGVVVEKSTFLLKPVVRNGSNGFLAFTLYLYQGPGLWISSSATVHYYYQTTNPTTLRTSIPSVVS